MHSSFSIIHFLGDKLLEVFFHISYHFLDVSTFIFYYYLWHYSFVSHRLLKTCNFINLRTSEVILFCNFLIFYWHFVEFLWIFIFLVFYKLFLMESRNRLSFTFWHLCIDPTSVSLSSVKDF